MSKKVDVEVLKAKVRRLRDDRALWASKCYMILDKLRVLRPLVFNQVQMAIYLSEQEQLAANGRSRTITLKGRQGGVTTYEQASALHTIWSVKGATALTLASDLQLTDKIFRITNRAVDNFPMELLPQVGPRETKEISFPSRDSRFYTGTAGAKRAGMGLTLTRFHGSEFAFWDEPKDALSAVTPSLEAPGTVADLETTGGGYDSEAHNFWREAAGGKNGYTALFFPWWECDPVHYCLPLLAPDELGKLEDEEKELIKLEGLTREQIKWRRQKISEMGRADFMREYAEDDETCWLAAGGMFYDAQVLKALMTQAPKPVATERDGELRLYIKPEDRGRSRIIIGADTAEGGGDQSTMKARRMEDWRNVMEFGSSAIEPKEFASLLNMWGRKLGNALLVVEKNLHGITVLRHLRDDHRYPIDKIYHRVSVGNTEQEKSKKIGWYTSAESKPLMLDAGRELLNAVKEGHAEAPTAAVLRDLFSVRRDKTGRVSLNGRDSLVADQLAWMGRSYPVGGSMIRVVDMEEAA